MKKYEIDFMYLVLRLRFDAYTENISLFKVLDDIVQYYEEYFTNKYVGSVLKVLGEEGKELTLCSIRGDRAVSNLHGILRPNSQLYYDIKDETGRTIKYHYSWVEFK